ncbi:MAG: hypothetical protein JXA30_22290, partial [Deltaproteobacteria bacterium]|nr:hypothetical protein [Deltaproteobacteria bacterium]
VPSSPALRARSVLRANWPPTCLTPERLHFALTLQEIRRRKPLSLAKNCAKFKVHFLKATRGSFWSRSAVYSAGNAWTKTEASIMNIFAMMR